MQVKKWIKIILVSGSVLALAACHSAHKNAYDGTAIDDANASYNGAESSGTGDESRFGDEASANSRNALAKRVYYFDYDSNVVHSSDRPAIDANANYLIAHSNVKVLLEGHTDPRGSREYNIGLGERRAKAVADILAAKGVNPSQIRVVSYGAEKLAVQGHSEAAYQQDRRVVLVHLQR